MISKDIASIIAKYNKPKVFQISCIFINGYNNPFVKYFFGSSKEDIIKLIYDKRHDCDWIKTFYKNSLRGWCGRCIDHRWDESCEEVKCKRETGYDDFNVWLYIFSRIAHIDEIQIEFE